MTFMCIANFIFLVLSSFIDQDISAQYEAQNSIFG
jgi:hypothetical protein